MKHLVIIGALLLVIFGGAGLLGPWMLSYNAEREFFLAIENLSRPGAYSFNIISYDRGWFNSNARTAMTLEGDWAEEWANTATTTEQNKRRPVLYLNHFITHGPFIIDDDMISLALAQASSTAAFPSEFDLLTTVLLEDQPILNFQTVVGFTGGSATTFASPGYKGPLLNGAVLSYSGFHGKIVQDTNSVSIAANLPQFAYQSSQGSISVRNIVFTGDYQKLEGIDLLGFGPTDFTVQSLVLTKPASQTTDQQSLYLELDKLMIRSNATKKGGIYDFTATLGIGGGSGTDMAIGENRLDISINNFPEKSLVHLYRQWNSLQEELRLDTDQRKDLAKFIEPVLNAIFHEGLTGSYDMRLNIVAGNNRFIGSLKIALDSYPQGMNAYVNVDIEEFAVLDVDLRQSNIRFNLTGLNSKGLRNAYADMIEIRASVMPVWQQEMEIAASFDKVLPNLITPKSKFVLENLALKTVQGVMVGQGSIGFVGTELIDWSGRAALISRLRGDASARISEPFLVKLLADQKFEGIRQGMVNTNRAADIDEDLISSLAEKLAQSSISEYEAKSVLIRDGKMFVVEIDMQNGRMLINGIDQTSLLTLAR